MPTRTLDDRHMELAEETERMARVNAASAELLAELESSQEQLAGSNRQLAAANARSAELVARLQGQREELEWTNSQLTSAYEQVNRVLSVLAHDMRGGLGGIVALLEDVTPSVASTPGVDPFQVESLQLIETEGRRLQEMLADLLAEVRSARNPDEMNLRAVPICTAIDTAVAAHRPIATRKFQSLVAVAFDRPDDPVSEARLRVDPVCFRQILDNLISNAIKYSPESSPIEIQVRKGVPDSTKVSIAVCDRGPGFTRADLQKIFGEFATLSAKPTGGELSHGLGLAIVHRLVDLHGGSIEARNRPDGGAEIVFDLPLIC